MDYCNAVHHDAPTGTTQKLQKQIGQPGIHQVYCMKYHRRLWTGNVQRVCSATYQIFCNIF